VKPDWALAACVGHDPEIWFPTQGNMNLSNLGAITICRGCPIRTDCADHATRHHYDGIWGGLTTSQRRLLARKP